MSRRCHHRSVLLVAASLTALATIASPSLARAEGNSVAAQGEVAAAVPEVSPPPPIAGGGEDAEAPPAKWYDAIKLEGFVDAYASANFNAPKPNVNTLRAFDVNNGASLHWAGLNASFAPEPVGGTLSLRFGPSAPIYNGADASIGLTYVKQAFASWKPFERWTIDVGKYDQPFGSEVADSQYNLNYTRSALYAYAQPLFFTGARVDFAATDAVDVKLFAVNGWNRTVDNNSGKSGGAQLTIKPSDAFLIALGYLGGPEQADVIGCASGTRPNTTTGACDPAAGAPASSAEVSGANSRLRHLADAVIDATPIEHLRLLFNADYGTEKLPTQTVKWYGANLVVAYAFSPIVAAAVRGEYYADPDGFTLGTGAKSKMIDGTVTLSVTPTKNLLLKLDLRMDRVDVDGVPNGIFLKGSSDTSRSQLTSTLGVVATTN